MPLLLWLIYLVYLSLAHTDTIYESMMNNFKDWVILTACHPKILGYKTHRWLVVILRALHRFIYRIYAGDCDLDGAMHDSQQ